MLEFTAEFLWGVFWGGLLFGTAVYLVLNARKNRTKSKMLGDIDAARKAYDREANHGA